jgi:hypothetical protein
MQTAWERELGRKSVLRRQYSSLELACMTLHLIAMLVDTTKEVGAAMNIKHDAITFGDC